MTVSNPTHILLTLTPDIFHLGLLKLMTAETVVTDADDTAESLHSGFYRS